jgi:ribosomal protein L20
MEKTNEFEGKEILKSDEAAKLLGITFCVFMSGGHSTNLNINRKPSARLHKHAVRHRFLI